MGYCLIKTGYFFYGNRGTKFAKIFQLLVATLLSRRLAQAPLQLQQFPECFGIGHRCFAGELFADVSGRFAIDHLFRSEPRSLIQLGTITRAPSLRTTAVAP
jgi:hypothetical protein